MMWYTTIRYMGTYRSVIQVWISDTLCNSTALRYSTVVTKVTLDGSRHCHSLTTSSGCALAITALIRGSVLGLVQDSRYLYSDHDAHLQVCMGTSGAICLCHHEDSLVGGVATMEIPLRSSSSNSEAGACCVDDMTWRSGCIRNQAGEWSWRHC